MESREADRSEFQWIVQYILSSFLREDLCQKCQPSNTYQETFAYLWANEAVQRLTQISLEKSGKDEIQSREFRESGNFYYKSRKMNKALECYNNCIVYASYTSNGEGELAKGYANRSALLFELKEYQKSITDIERAQQRGYSNVERIQARRNKCIRLIERKKLAENDEDVNRKQVYQLFNYHFPDAPKILQKNESILGCADSVEISYAEECGRFLRSKRKILPGEVLVVEKAYASFCSQEFKHIYCTFCMQRTLTPVPCPNCIQVVYCSEKCQEKSWQEFHRTECNILGPMIKAGMQSRAFLVLRILSRLTLDTVITNTNTLEKEHGVQNFLKNGFDENGIYNSEDYRVIYNFETIKSYRSPHCILNECILAVMLIKFLIKGSVFFLNNDVVSDKVVLVGSVALQLILAMSVNSFSVGDRLIDGPTNGLSERSRGNKIGSGIFPASSLLNHSCYSNCIRVFFGNIIAIQAIDIIPRHSKVTISYISDFIEADISKRQTMVATKYGFKCNCEACIGNWTYNVDSEIVLKCERCSTPVSFQELNCKFCNKTLDPSFNLKLNEAAYHLLSIRKAVIKLRNSLDAAVDLKTLSKYESSLVTYLELLHEYAVPPQEFVFVRNELTRLYLRKGSRFVQCP